jgi:bacillithiol biosynthesis cysteine-adding enzyme BshC
MAHYPQDKREQTKSTDNKKNLSLPSIGVYSNLNQSSPTKHQKQWKKTPVKYDNLAETYDQDTSKYGCASLDHIIRSLIEHAPPKCYERILDVGVGTGQTSKIFLDIGAQVVGLDISKNMLKLDSERSPLFHHLIDHAIDDPLSTAGIDPESFDTIVASGVLHFAKDLPFTLKELAVALVPGGVLSFTFIPNQKRKVSDLTHLHEPSIVLKILQNQEMIILDSKQFFAYPDEGNSGDPLEYVLVTAQKKGQRREIPEGLKVLTRSACVDRQRIFSLIQTPLACGPMMTRWCGFDDVQLRQEVDQMTKLFFEKFRANHTILLSDILLPTHTAKVAGLGQPGCDVLAIFAHPDDEAIIGGTLSSLSIAKRSIQLLVATDGGGGKNLTNAENLASVRLKELEESVKILGIEGCTVLGFPDLGKFNDKNHSLPVTALDTLKLWGIETLLESLVYQIRKYKPRLILGFESSRDFFYSLHGHHLALGLASAIAFHLAADPLAFPEQNLAPWAVDAMYGVVPFDTLSERLTIVKGDLAKKKAAILAHRSQFSSVGLSLKLDLPEFWHLVQARKGGGLLEELLKPSNVERTAKLKHTIPKVASAILHPNDPVGILFGQRSISKVISDIQSRPYPRKEIVSILKAQQMARGCKDGKVYNNIYKILDPKTTLIVTGQQVGILGGPLYTLYKALEVVVQAKKLEQLGMSIAPLFWLASYDADLKEVMQANIVGSTKKFKVHSSEVNTNKHPVGGLKIGSRIVELLDELDQSVAKTPKKDSLMADLRSIYNEESTFTEAFVRLMGRLTDQHGLIFLDPSHRDFAALTRQIIEKELFGTYSSQTAIDASNTQLQALGHKVLIKKNVHRLNVFFIDDNGMRVLLRRAQNGCFETGGSPNKLKEEDIRRILKEEPERFVPSALLRPIVEDFVLPTAAYVAGASELSYFAQIGGVYDWAAVTKPSLVLRPSLSLISSFEDKRFFELIGKHVEQLLNEGQLAEEIGWAGLPQSLVKAYKNLRCQVLNTSTCLKKIRKFILQKNRKKAWDLVKNQSLIIACCLEEIGHQAEIENCKECQNEIKIQLPRLQICYRKFLKEIVKSKRVSGHIPSCNSLGKGANILKRMIDKALKLGRKRAFKVWEVIDRLQPGGILQERVMTVGQLFIEMGPRVTDTLLQLIELRRSDHVLVVLKDEISRQKG